MHTKALLLAASAAVLATGAAHAAKWALMLTGFAGLGSALRRRRALPTA